VCSSDLKHANLRRQSSVHGNCPPGWRKPVVNVDMRALTEGVDASVSSAGAVHPDRFARDFCQCPLQMILNSVAVKLALPTGKVRSIVRDHQLEPLTHEGYLASSSVDCSEFWILSR